MALRERLSAKERRAPETPTSEAATSSNPPFPPQPALRLPHGIAAHAPAAAIELPQEPQAAFLPQPALGLAHAMAAHAPTAVVELPREPPPGEAYPSVYDATARWELVRQASSVVDVRSMYLVSQPPPAGMIELPLEVLAFTAQHDADAAQVAAAPDQSEALNASLLRACWSPRLKVPKALAMASPATEATSWSKMLATAPRRLVVLCGASFAAMQNHPAVVEHTSILVHVASLSDEACAARGGSDNLADLWQAMHEGCPLLFLESACSTRRARKQLLHKLSKQSVAAKYAWEALNGNAPHAGEGMLTPPALDEGWAVIHSTM